MVNGLFLMWRFNAKKLGLALYGAGAAILISFAVLLTFWRKPKIGDASTGRPLPAGHSGPVNTVAFLGDLVVSGGADGRVLRTIDTREAVDEDAAPMRVAVAGTGDVYVMDRWTGEIYHLDPTGRFRDRFGGRSGPGREGMGAPQDLAIDGRGRVFVSDMMGGIHVFGADGGPVGVFGGELNPFGITFNDRDELFATNRNDHEVVKYRLSR